MQTNTCICPLLGKDGQKLPVSDADKANVLNTFSSSVLAGENTTRENTTNYILLNGPKVRGDNTVTLKAMARLH